MSCILSDTDKRCILSDVDKKMLSAVNNSLIQPFHSEASYSLRVRAHRYWNSGHKLADGTCCDKTGSSSCDPFWCTFCECDNRFTFCLRRFGANRDRNVQNCPLGSYSTGEIGDDGFSFGSSQIASGVSNPMIFRGDIWRVSHSITIGSLIQLTVLS